MAKRKSVKLTAKQQPVKAASVSRRTVAEHEAAHTVMRYLLGIPVGMTRLTDYGGISEPARDGIAITTTAALMITISGFAWEARGGKFILERCQGQDFDVCLGLLGNGVTLRTRITKRKTVTTDSVPKALYRYAGYAWEILSAYKDQVNAIATEVDKKGFAPAEFTTAVMRGAKPAFEISFDARCALEQNHLR